VSAPERCTIRSIALKPIAALIVDAELSRTKIKDEGVTMLGGVCKPSFLGSFAHSGDVARFWLANELRKLESLNLTATDVDEEGVRHSGVSLDCDSSIFLATNAGQNAIYGGRGKIVS